MGSADYGIDAATVDAIAREIAEVSLQLRAGDRRRRGSIYRGMEAAAEEGMDRATGDYIRDARHGHERAHAAGRAGARRRRDSRAVGDRDRGGGGAVHPAPRDAPPREAPNRHLRGGDRQPVLHDRHGRRAAPRNRCGGDPDGRNTAPAATTADPNVDPNAEFLPGSRTGKRSSAGSRSWT